MRHTIEPDVGYRYVTGINNFQQVLRFDDTDVASNTNELQYGLTQRLFLRHLHPHPCKGDEALGPDTMCGGGTRDWISWRVAQKHYFEPDFDHAITPGTPNPLTTTLDFTGIDFLTDARHNTSGDLAAANADDGRHRRGVGSGLRREGGEDHVEQYFRGLSARLLPVPVRRFVRQRAAGHDSADDGEDAAGVAQRCRTRSTRFMCRRFMARPTSWGRALA